MTLDTGALGPARKRIEAACRERTVDLTNTTVTERELKGTKIVPLSKPVLETGVWDESQWDAFVWGESTPVPETLVRETLVLNESPLGIAVLGDDSSQAKLDAILQIICAGGFPARSRRNGLSRGHLHQLRDAMILEAHAREGRDIFVTGNTKDFINGGRREALEELCSTKIRAVEEFCHYMKPDATQ